MISLNGINDFASALEVFIASDPHASANPGSLSLAILKRLSPSFTPIRPLCLVVVSLVILKVTLLQEVFYANEDRGISTALQDHFTNRRYWLTITPEIQSPLYPSRPNSPPDLQFYKGAALMSWQNHPVMVYRDGAQQGHYRFYCIWPSSQPIRSLFVSLQPDLPVAFLYLPAHVGDKRSRWAAHRIPLRRIDTIHFGAKEKIMAKIEKHQSTKSRENWVFEGPPGVGKTSMAFAVAAKLNQPLFSFPIMNKQMDDSIFKLWLEQLPANAVVLMDDVGYPFPEKLSNTCVLDFLDGTMAALHPGRLLIVNNNSQGFVKSLPGPLKRAGRLSETLHFSWATPSDAEAMFMQEHHGSLLEEPNLQEFARTFGAHVEGRCISHAAIELFLRNCTAHEAVENAASLSAGGEL